MKWKTKTQVFFNAAFEVPFFLRFFDDSRKLKEK